MALGHSVLLVTALASMPVVTPVNGDGARSPACMDEHVSIEGTLSREGADEVERVCLELPSWRNLDPAVHVQLRSTATTLDLDARSGDGRTARRELHTPQELRATMKALLTLPEPIAVTLRPDTEGAIALDTSREPPAIADAPVATAQRTPRGDVEQFHLVSLLAATGRISGSHVYESAGGEGAVALAVREWSFGLTARWDALNVTADRPTGFEMDTIGVGFLVLRCVFRSPHRLSVDGGASTTIVTESQSLQDTRGEQTASTTDARLGLVSLARWGSSSLRGAVLLEAELSPERVRKQMRLGASFPNLPVWSVGLDAGIAWGDP